MCQSSNDVIPSTIHVSAALEITGKLLPALEHLKKTIDKKARSVKGIVKTGRTHLMDAMPVRLDPSCTQKTPSPVTQKAIHPILHPNWTDSRRHSRSLR